MDYIHELCDNLNAAHIRDYVWKDNALVGTEFTPESLIMQAFQYLPENNLDQLVKWDVYSCKSFDELLQAWTRCHALDFEPYIYSDDCNCPVLVLAWDQYLYLTGDMFFELTTSMSTLESVYQGTYSLDSFKNIYNEHALSYYRLVYALLFEVGFRSPQFRKLVTSNIEIVDNYVLALMESLKLTCELCWSDCMKRVEVLYGSPNYRSAQNYVFVFDESTCLAVLSVDSEYISLETCLFNGRHVVRRAGIKVFDLFDNYSEAVCTLVILLGIMSGLTINFGTLQYDNSMVPFQTPNVRNVCHISNLLGLEEKMKGDKKSKE